MFILKKSDKISLATQGFRLCGGDQRAMKTDEVCGRPLDSFAPSGCYLSFIGSL